MSAALLLVSITVPWRATLSTTITVPGRESLIAHSRYCGLFSLSASIKIKSNGPALSAFSCGKLSSAGPTRIATRRSNPARRRFARATSACRGSNSSETIRPPRASARHPDRRIAAKQANLEDAFGLRHLHQHVQKFSLQRRNIDGRKSSFAIGLERSVKMRVMRSKEFAEIAINRSPMRWGVVFHGRVRPVAVWYQQSANCRLLSAYY